MFSYQHSNRPFLRNEYSKIFKDLFNDIDSTNPLATNPLSLICERIFFISIFIFLPADRGRYCAQGLSEGHDKKLSFSQQTLSNARVEPSHVSSKT